MKLEHKQRIPAVCVLCEIHCPCCIRPLVEKRRWHQRKYRQGARDRLRSISDGICSLQEADASKVRKKLDTRYSLYEWSGKIADELHTRNIKRDPHCSGKEKPNIHPEYLVPDQRFSYSYNVSFQQTRIISVPPGFRRLSAIGIPTGSEQELLFGESLRWNTKSSDEPRNTGGRVSITNRKRLRERGKRWTSCTNSLGWILFRQMLKVVC